MKINAIACGQGAPSMYLIRLAYEGLFPCDLVMVYDTGNENDMLWSNEQRTTAKEFFEQVTKPLANSYGFDAVYVRARDKRGNQLPDLHLDQRNNGKVEIDLPMFGSNGGRLKQSCTEKYKKSAGRQELKRRGAKRAIVNLGLTMDEVHRVKENNVKWEKLQYPLIFLKKMYRAEIEQEMVRLNIPYIIRTQCDFCPHKDFFRWRNTSPETIEQAAEFEKRVGKGEYFLTSYLIPLKEVLQKEAELNAKKINMFDYCNNVCFT